MPAVEYALPGDAAYQERLYPPLALISPNPPANSMLGAGVPFKTQSDVIAHYTLSSLRCDRILIEEGSLQVRESKGRFSIQFQPQAGFESDANDFATMHQKFLDEDHAGQAMLGEDLMKALTNAWNPMSGFPVNKGKADGLCKWELFLPLGMGMVNHRSVTLLHYPPYIALAGADYLHNNTLDRWQNLLFCNGLTVDEHWQYTTIIDVNPVAAPGSGQSEYNNDYFPILMSCAFFDADPGKPGGNYVRSILDLFLNPPHAAKNNYTLPLLIGGSPLYDPQAPGWFRVRYKDKLPQDTKNVPNAPPGIPRAAVMDAGEIRIFADSKRPTPYMIANHMIAAGVTGLCTNDASKIPDIRQYAAQDLAAAAFLAEYHNDPNTAAEEARRKACLKWFGNANGTGIPTPPDSDDQKKLAAICIVDLNFNPKTAKPKYTLDEAESIVANSSSGSVDACACQQALNPATVT